VHFSDARAAPSPPAVFQTLPAFPLPESPTASQAIPDWRALQRCRVAQLPPAVFQTLPASPLPGHPTASQVIPDWRGADPIPSLLLSILSKPERAQQVTARRRIP